MEHEFIDSLNRKWQIFVCDYIQKYDQGFSDERIKATLDPILETVLFEEGQTVYEGSIILFNVYEMKYIWYDAETNIYHADIDIKPSTVTTTTSTTEGTEVEV